MGKLGTTILRSWLRLHALQLRGLEKSALDAYRSGDMSKVCARIAVVHGAAAVLYETELAKLEAEQAGG